MDQRIVVQTVASAVGHAAASHGVRHCFGVVGSGNFHVTNGLIEAGVEFTQARHESGAVAMADAYARVSGELAVATVHTGPGLTNAMTTIAEAAKSRTPLLVLAGATARGALRSNFAIDQGDAIRAVSASAEWLYRPDTALADVHRAAETALRERRTVVLNMPMDVQVAHLPGSTATVSKDVGAGRGFGVSKDSGTCGSIHRPHPAPAGVQALTDLIAKAERPLFLAGRGAVIADAPDAIRTLGRHVGALLATSACAHGAFQDDPWCVGMSGGLSSPAAVELIAASDLLIGFGTTWTHWTTRLGSLVSDDATVVQIDVEPTQIGWHRPVDLGVVGDARVVAEMAYTAMADTPSRSGWRTPDVAAQLRDKSNHAREYVDTSPSGYVDPRTLSKELDHILPAERTVVLDSGHFMTWPARYLSVPDVHGWVFAQGFQSIGLGLAQAIGAATARPDRLTVLVAGDGGFLMGIAELETAIRLSRRMVIIVYNDAAYGAELHHFGPAGYPTKTVEFPDVDFAAIGRGFGAQSIAVRDVADLDPLRAWLAAKHDGTFIVDAKVTPNLVADWLQEAFQGNQ